MDTDTSYKECNGIERTNQIENRQCLACGEEIEVGDDVLYFYSARDTSSAKGGHVHIKCLDQLKIKEKGQLIPILDKDSGGYRSLEVSGRERCCICREKDTTHMGVTGQSSIKSKMPFHLDCIEGIKDLRIEGEELEKLALKKKKTKENRLKNERLFSRIKVSKGTHRVSKENPSVSITLINRGDGKLVEAILHYWDIDDSNNFKSIIYQRSWKIPHGGKPLEIMLKCDSSLTHKIEEAIRELQLKYDKKGFPVEES